MATRRRTTKGKGNDGTNSDPKPKLGPTPTDEEQEEWRRKNVIDAGCVTITRRFGYQPPPPKLAEIDGDSDDQA